MNWETIFTDTGRERRRRIIKAAFAKAQAQLEVIRSLGGRRTWRIRLWFWRFVKAAIGHDTPFLESRRWRSMGSGVANWIMYSPPKLESLKGINPSKTFWWRS